MKYSRIVAALLAVTLMACSKKEKEPTPSFPEVPADVTFDKSSLTSLTDQEFNSAKSVLKVVSSVEGFEDQLTVKYEDDESRKDREESYNKMTPAQQTLVERKRNDCTVDENKVEADFGSNFKSGASATSSETARIYGPLCGSESNMNMNGLTHVLSFDETSYNIDMGIKMSLTMNSNITNIADQAILGYSSMDGSFQSEARAQGSAALGMGAMYLTSSGTMNLNTIQAGTINLNLSIESLTRADKSSSSKVVGLFNVNGKTVQLVILIRQDIGGINKTEEVYLGNRLLTDADKTEVGDLGFAKDVIKPKTN